jgi:hypothetical protein
MRLFLERHGFRPVAGVMTIPTDSVVPVPPAHVRLSVAALDAFLESP